jgi:hypothetical protein
MSKKLFSILVAGALVASVFSALPAKAATEIPAVVNIEDISGDANMLNDQGFGSAGLGYQGDNAGGVNFANADLQKVWFTNTADTVSAHILTTVVPPNSRFGLIYRVMFNPSDSSADGCIWLQGIIPSISYAGPAEANVRDVCTKPTPELVPGEITIEALKDETGLTTITFPRSASPAFAEGATLAAPIATSRMIHGVPGTSRTLPQLDNTKVGIDYVLSDGDAPTLNEPPVDPPNKPATPVKKGCKKGKGKKKGCKKGTDEGPKGQSCATFTPGEAGTEKPTVVVTDAATEEAPLEQTVSLDMSLADFDFTGMVLPAEHDAINIQVDSNAADAGLYVLFEFPSRRDYDLNLLHADGSYAARSHGFNPIIPEGRPTTISNEGGHGGESTDASEKLVGIKTADCGGYTLDVANYLGEGGDMMVKLWLGESTIDPLAPGAETP